MSMEQDLHISIANEFSAYPAGRDDSDGEYNGARFRKELLLPKLREALKTGRHLVVSLEGMKSFGSSFLDEAFAGLVRHEKLDKASLNKTLRIDPGSQSNSRYQEAIMRYIERA